MTERVPTGFRPARAFHMAIARLMENDLYLWMTQEEFIEHLTEATNGHFHAAVIRTVYDGLIKEAGVEPLTAEPAIKKEPFDFWTNEVEKAHRYEWTPAKPEWTPQRKTIEQKLEEFKK